MHIEKIKKKGTCRHLIFSEFLKREVTIDLYFPLEKVTAGEISLLLINDGQDLVTMNFHHLLEELYNQEIIGSLWAVGIHCGEDRRNEYGTAHILNDKGEGRKAALYSRFIFEELLPFIKNRYAVTSFKEKSFCGFSLGGLSALDIVWNHPEEFSKVGVFTGSLWWRTLSQDDPGFTEQEHLIMHQEIKNGKYYPWLQFFFEAGTKDEASDRNHNGIIDSIDDTLALIAELVKKGYSRETDIHYLELKDGEHNVATWARAFPDFLKWGWGK